MNQTNFINLINYRKFIEAFTILKIWTCQHFNFQRVRTPKIMEKIRVEYDWVIWEIIWVVSPKFLCFELTEKKP